MSFIVLLNFAWRPMQNATTHRTPTPMYQFQFPSPLPPPCIHCHALQLAWLASRWAVYHLQRELSTRISQSPLALFTCLISLSLPLSRCLSLCLSNCQRSSLRTSWHWELFLCGFQILLQFVNSLLACFLCFFCGYISPFYASFPRGKFRE